MTMANTIIQKLTTQHFSGQMPEDLYKDLQDSYGKGPLHGDLSPQFFWLSVGSDIKNYHLNGCFNTSAHSLLQKR